MAARAGADRVIDVARQPGGLAAYEAGKGSFDLLLEASGSSRALTGALAALRPRGIVVQFGIMDEAALPMSLIVAKEIELRGTFRFHEEFALAVRFIAQGLVDVGPLLTEIVPLGEVHRAFQLAGDKSRSMKVQLAFD